MQQARRDEILAKKAKLAELKRQRELRANQATSGRQSMGSPSELVSPTPGRTDSRREIESLINSLVGDSRPASTGIASPSRRGSRPNSVLSAGELSAEVSEYAVPANAPANAQAVASTSSPQVLTTVPLTTVYEVPPSPVKEVFTYSKGVQTTDDFPAPPTARQRAISELDDDEINVGTTTTPSKRLSRRDRDREEELRQNVRKEIEEELKAARDLVTDGVISAGSLLSSNYPARALTSEEKTAIEASDDFVDFVERSTKVIERALDQEYDILTDYTLQVHDDADDEDARGNVSGKGRRRIKEVCQFYDEKWSKKRMVTAISFSPKFPELVLASYTKNPTAPNEPDGLVQVWNIHTREHPEFVFTAQSDVLTAKFSPFHPNLIVGGTYSGQVCLWDTRSRSQAPVQKTPLTGTSLSQHQPHTHPIYAVDIVGTQNAHNIVSVSTDGALNVWSVDMLSQPQESMILTNPAATKLAFDDIAPTSLTFPSADPTFFLIGAEDGGVYPCHRYDRAGAKAGVDARTSYQGHKAPIMSVDFHPSHGPLDLGDLVLTSSLDWSVKLWKVRAPTTANTVLPDSSHSRVPPILDIVREDVVYDAAWSPARPSVFGLVDGAGSVEIFDLNIETEVPVVKISPSQRTGKGQDGRAGGAVGIAGGFKSLNKIAWEPTEGKRVAVGGIDGAVTVFEVGADLGGKEGVRSEEWSGVRKLVSRIEALGA